MLGMTNLADDLKAWQTDQFSLTDQFSYTDQFYDCCLRRKSRFTCKFLLNTLVIRERRMIYSFQLSLVTTNQLLL